MKNFIMMILALLIFILLHVVRTMASSEYQVWTTRCIIDNKEVIVPYVAVHQQSIDMEELICKDFAEAQLDLSKF